MNARELQFWLDGVPPLTEVYVEVSETALQQVKAVRYDKQLGCVELITNGSKEKRL